MKIRLTNEEKVELFDKFIANMQPAEEAYRVNLTRFVENEVTTEEARVLLRFANEVLKPHRDELFRPFAEVMMFNQIEDFLKEAGDNNV